MSRIARNLVILNLFFLQSYLVRFKIAEYSTNLQEVLILATLLFFAISIFQRKKVLQTLKNILRYRMILIFCLLTAISFLAVQPENSLDFYRYIKFLGFAVLLTFMTLETFRTDTEKKHIIKTMGIGALIFGIFSLFYNLAGNNVAPDYRLLGPLDAAVYLAYYLAPFFIFFTIESLENHKNKLNIILAILLGLLLVGTLSMGAIGGSILILGFYILKRSNIEILKKKTTKIFIGLTILLAIVVTFYSKILPTIQNENSSLDERGQIWATSVELLRTPQNFLLGLGPNQFQEYYFQNVAGVLGKEPLDYYVLQPHNIFLVFVFNYGILGLIFITLLIYLTIKKVFTIKDRITIEQISALIFGYFLIHGLIDTPFFKNDLLIILLIILEIAFTYLRPETKAKRAV